MAKFMMILHETPNQEYRNLSPEQIQRTIEKYRAWAGKLAAAGKLSGGMKLAEEGGKWVTMEKSRIAVVDGPYSETKEIVGGYFVCEAADYAEAVDLVRDCPHVAHGRIEIRQVDPVTGTDDCVLGALKNQSETRQVEPALR
jgi:hypothetical protein